MNYNEHESNVNVVKKYWPKYEDGLITKYEAFPHIQAVIECIELTAFSANAFDQSENSWVPNHQARSDKMKRRIDGLDKVLKICLAYERAAMRPIPMIYDEDLE